MFANLKKKIYFLILLRKAIKTSINKPVKYQMIKLFMLMQIVLSKIFFQIQFFYNQIHSFINLNEEPI